MKEKRREEKGDTREKERERTERGKGLRERVSGHIQQDKVNINRLKVRSPSRHWKGTQEHVHTQ